ncbi:D-glycerate dehydrogenase [Salinibacter sp. 10B]|uniref:2-hydroxyacid dehydrogenase n=1 Tax=Salinibacter sp. 10B TaxID=1923971 RepID=UPI000CF5183C|nr:D-glycerate dehydrogenase [Salinibacter sp. 10B]PQJ35406.1 D-glycerate dehydrogenase [Salinibacter sp. 10B]
MAHVVVTRPLVEGGLTELRKDHTVTVCDPPEGAARSEEELIALADGADVLLTVLADPVTERVFAACPDLKMVAQYAVGIDNIDLDAAQAHDVVVTHTPGVLTDATADMAWALLLAAARRVPAADDYVREGQFERWETTLLLGTELADKTMGIVGLGRIGAAVARRALGFGMNVVYHNRTRANPTVERQTSAQYVELEELLSTSDVVSLHCPLNEDSRHLIDAAALGRMKDEAILVNTARGAVVDEAALVEALSAGSIAGAALDVFEDEPDVHPGLMEQDRVVLAPHLGSATTETRTEMVHMCVESIRARLSGAEEIPHRAV